MAYSVKTSTIRISGTNFARGNAVVTEYSVAGTSSINTTTDVITITTSAPANGTVLNYREDATVTSVGGLTLGQNYFVINSSGSTFKLSETSGGSAIDLTGTPFGAAGVMFQEASSFSIKTQNISNPFKAVYWNSAFDEAINGFLRTNLRGFRFESDLRWDKNTQPDIIRDLFNDIYWEIVTNGSDSINISFDGGSNEIAVIPTSLDYLVQWKNQIGARLVPSLSVIGRDILTELPDYLQAP